MSLSDLAVEGCKRRTAEAGEVIFLEGQPANCAYVILKGHAEVVAQGAGGAPVVLARMKPGELFGEVALLTQSKARTATVMAAERCELLEIDGAVFASRLDKTDALVRFVLDHVTRRLVQLTDKVVGADD